MPDKNRNKNRSIKGTNANCPDKPTCDISKGYQAGEEFYYCVTCKKERNDYKGR